MRGGGRGEGRGKDERRIYICKKRGGIWLEFLASRILLGNKQLDCTSTPPPPFLHSEYINYRQYFTSLQSWAQNRYFVTRYGYSLFVTR